MAKDLATHAGNRLFVSWAPRNPLSCIKSQWALYEVGIADQLRFRISSRRGGNQAHCLAEGNMHLVIFTLNNSFVFKVCFAAYKDHWHILLTIELDCLEPQLGHIGKRSLTCHVVSQDDGVGFLIEVLIQRMKPLHASGVPDDHFELLPQSQNY